MKTVHLTWESGTFSNNWNITGVETRRIPFKQPLLPWNRAKPLSALSSRARFEAVLTENPMFSNFWTRATGGYGDEPVRFIFHCGTGPWRLPWELLLQCSDERGLAHAVITRGDGATDLIQPTQFGQPLRIQMVLGDNSGRRGPRLDLDKEMNEVRNLYDGLERSVRTNVQLLEPIQPSLDELELLLKDRKPDVLWFSGHGLASPPAFCLKPTDGRVRDLTPRRLAEFLQKHTVRPIYTVFLACHLALSGKNSPFETAPEFFDALAPCGVQGVLAMQGPVIDRAAVLLSSALFRYLAIGHPLDRATAIARNVIRDAMPDNSLEWARPAVWSAGVPPEQLQLNFDNSNRAKTQVSARQILRARLAAPAEMDASIDPFSRRRVQQWLAFEVRRLQLLGSPLHTGVPSLWIRLVRTLQNISGQPVIAIELDSADTERALRVWAEAVTQEAARWHEPFFRSADILPRMLDDPKNAWRDLCATKEVIIAIQDSHERELEEWFLAPLEERHADLTLLLRAKPLSAPMPTENLDMQSQTPQSLTALAERHRALLHCMTVVGMPVRESWVQDAQLTDNLLGDIGESLVDTGAGYALNASASAYFATLMSEADKVEAHSSSMQVLDHLDVRRRASGNPAVGVLRLKHCLGAQKKDEAIQESQAVLWQIRKLDRPWRALEIGELIDHLHRQFTPTLSLQLAWASIMTGDIGLGSLRLNQAKRVSDPVEKAWYHGLSAEVAKSKGLKQEALNEIDNAIAVLSEINDKQPWLRERLVVYRQDKARIHQYFCHEYAQARQEYEQILKELAGSDNKHLFATVQRNYSECLRSLAKDKSDPLWTRARDIIDEELQRLFQDPQVWIVAELLYERARIAFAEGDRTKAYDLLQKCLQAAASSRHQMIAAIAKARQFWEFEQFDLAKWRTIESQLNISYRHGWAIRTAMQGRLRAAKRLEASQPNEALKLLKRNLADVASNPGLEGGSDRERIARTYSGLVALNGGTRHWDTFLESYSWAKSWAASAPSRNATDLWKGVQ